MNLNISNLNPVKVENFFAYGKGSPHYGKLKLKLNYNPYKMGEDIQVDTAEATIEGIIEHIEGNIVVMKIKKLIHKVLAN